MLIEIYEDGFNGVMFQPSGYMMTNAQDEHEALQDVFHVFARDRVGAERLYFSEDERRIGFRLYDLDARMRF